MPFSSKLLQMGAAGAGEKLYVEDVFSTYLYTGNGSTQTITNNIDLSTEGGLVWLKSRAFTYQNILSDTVNGAGKFLISDATNALGTDANDVTAFNTTGFSIGNNNRINYSGSNFVSWTFRKAKKFFDVVTYTGNGTNPRNISHNLGSTPGCIVVKRTDTTGNWNVYHRSAAASGFTAEQCYMYLNSTNAVTDNSTFWSDTAPTSTQFTVGSASNANGGTYVAYLFAHDAGGFGDAGSDNVITCGSFTTDGSGNATVSLGYEPQWVMLKQSSGTGDWLIFDNMRGMSVTTGKRLMPNLSNAESETINGACAATATGFTIVGSELPGSNNSATFIYIAIRRGPMKTPTSGTSVYKGIKYTGNGNTKGNLISLDFPADLLLRTIPSITNSTNMRMYDRLRGQTACIKTHSTAAEITNEGGYFLDSNVGVFPGDPNNVGNTGTTNDGSTEYMLWNFRRAPGFFDVVCYTGTGSATTFSHNLGVTPELMIVKQRNSTNPWRVYSSPTGATKHLALNTDAAETTSSANWNDTAPTSTVFTVGTGTGVNGSGSTYVNYLFASVSGVSKVGSYTGNGSSVTVTTGFQPRFILVKRTDSTGNWIVGDSARGLVAGNDPYLLLNSTAAEDTDEDWVDVSSTGFTVNETTANANVNTATYIYLAIA